MVGPSKEGGWKAHPSGRKGGNLALQKTRVQKESIVADLRSSLGQAKAIFVSDYRGLKVAEMTELRKRLRDCNAEYRVVKNTLMRLAIKDGHLQGLDEFVEGPTAVVVVKGEPVEVARVLKDFLDEFPAIRLKGGLLEEKVLQAEDVERLSKLPPREVLLGKVVGGLNALPVRMVYVFNGLLQKLVMTLKAVEEKKRGQSQS